MLKKPEITVTVTDVRGIQPPKKYMIRGKGLKLMAAVFHVPFVALLAGLFLHFLLLAVNGHGIDREGKGFVLIGCLAGFCSLVACLVKFTAMGIPEVRGTGVNRHSVAESNDSRRPRPECGSFCDFSEILVRNSPQGS